MCVRVRVCVCACECDKHRLTRTHCSPRAPLCALVSQEAQLLLARAFHMQQRSQDAETIYEVCAFDEPVSGEERRAL